MKRPRKRGTKTYMQKEREDSYSESLVLREFARLGRLPRMAPRLPHRPEDETT